MTRDEAIQECLDYGWSRSECETEVDDTMVDGAYCDGTIVITAEGKRCVSDALAARVKAARAAQPLPVATEAPSPLDAISREHMVIAGAALLVGGLVVWFVARR